MYLYYLRFREFGSPSRSPAGYLFIYLFIYLFTYLCRLYYISSHKGHLGYPPQNSEKGLSGRLALIKALLGSVELGAKIDNPPVSRCK
jgi:hypothetical protein